MKQHCHILNLNLFQIQLSLTSQSLAAEWDFQIAVIMLRRNVPRPHANQPRSWKTNYLWANISPVTWSPPEHPAARATHQPSTASRFLAFLQVADRSWRCGYILEKVYSLLCRIVPIPLQATYSSAALQLWTCYMLSNGCPDWVSKYVYGY